MSPEHGKSDERLNQRRTAILAAARRLFLEKGFEETTLSHVVGLAGGSLATVYKLFGSKEGLLHAVVFERVRTGADFIRDVARQDLPPPVALKEVGLELQRRFLDADDVALARISITRSSCDPAFARQFYERTHMPTMEALQILFERWQQQGHELSTSPRLLARIFLSILIEDLRSETFYQNCATRLSCEERGQRIAFFLRGAGLEGEGCPCREGPPAS